MNNQYDQNDLIIALENYLQERIDSNIVTKVDDMLQSPKEIDDFWDFVQSTDFPRQIVNPVKEHSFITNLSWNDSLFLRKNFVEKLLLLNEQIHLNVEGYATNPVLVTELIKFLGKYRALIDSGRLVIHHFSKAFVDDEGFLLMKKLFDYFDSLKEADPELFGLENLDDYDINYILTLAGYDLKESLYACSVSGANFLTLNRYTYKMLTRFLNEIKDDKDFSNKRKFHFVPEILFPKINLTIDDIMSMKGYSKGYNEFLAGHGLILRNISSMDVTSPDFNNKAEEIIQQYLFTPYLRMKDEVEKSSLSRKIENGLLKLDVCLSATLIVYALGLISDPTAPAVGSGIGVLLEFLFKKLIIEGRNKGRITFLKYYSLVLEEE